jgi:hypothetical protein
MSRKTVRTISFLLLGIALVAAILFVVLTLPRQRAPAQPTGPLASGSASDARATLDQLRVAPVGSMSGYSRDRFHHWSQADKFGWSPPRPDCSTREAALVRDGQNVQVGSGCQVLSGTWLDPYTGKTFTKPSDVDIDHVVPLAAAWRAGANRWDDKRREQYANDPAVLLSVEDNANQEKGDKGPEAWKPPRREEWCDYAQRWISVKAKYGLAVMAPYRVGSQTLNEKAALTEMLNTCGAG